MMTANSKSSSDLKTLTSTHGTATAASCGEFSETMTTATPTSGPVRSPLVQSSLTFKATGDKT